MSALRRFQKTHTRSLFHSLFKTRKSKINSGVDYDNLATLKKHVGCVQLGEIYNVMLPENPMNVY